MKKLLLLLVALISINSAMGQKVLGPIIPNAPTDTYPTYFDTLGFGGFMSVPAYSDLLAIPSPRRKIGMAVQLETVDSLYRLIGGITNSNWIGWSFPQAINKSDTNTGGNPITISYFNTHSGAVPSSTTTLIGDITGIGVNTVTTTIKNDVNLAGNPTTTTQTTGDNSTRIATTAFVVNKISAIPSTTITLHGDVTGVGVNTITATLANFGSSGTAGSATQVPIITFDTKGRESSWSNITVTPDFSNITSLPTTLGGYGITDAYTKTISDSKYFNKVDSNTGNNPITISYFYSNLPVSVSPTTTLTGDATGVGVYTVNVTLASVGTAGTYGSGIAIPVITTDAKGRVTSVTTSTVSPTGVTAVTAGAGLSGGTITSTGTISLPNTGTAGTYGSGTLIPVITTDAQGRVSGVATATVTPDWPNITNRPTTVEAYSITNVYNKTTSDAIYARSVTLTSAGVIYNSPINFVNTSGSFTGSLTMASQSAYNVLLTGSVTATPTFGLLTRLHLPAGIGYTDVNQTWTKAQSSSIVDVVYSATVTPDFSLSNYYRLPLTGNFFLNTPTNLTEGQNGVIDLYQDTTGSRLLSSSSWAWRWQAGLLPTLSTGGVNIDYITYKVRLARTATVTITAAFPCVVTWNAHGLLSGTSIQFTTSGALPSPLTANTTYYIIRPTTNTFQLSTTLGGTAAISTSGGTQSGTQTVTATAIDATVINNSR